MAGGGRRFGTVVGTAFGARAGFAGATGAAVGSVFAGDSIVGATSFIGGGTTAGATTAGGVGAGAGAGATWAEPAGATTFCGSRVDAAGARFLKCFTTTNEPAPSAAAAMAASTIHSACDVRGGTTCVGVGANGAAIGGIGDADGTTDGA